MTSTLPGGATSRGEITDLQLLNGLDQIRDAAIFSSSLAPKTRKTIVQATDSVKRRTARPSEASAFAEDWEGTLLNTLSTQVAKKIRNSAEIDEETGKTVLRILNRYVPERDLLKDPPAE
jgi:hypothetical protein